MGVIIPGNDSCQVSGERLSLPLTEGTREKKVQIESFPFTF